MKTTINLISIFIIAGLLLVCCENDNNTEKSLNLSGTLTGHSTCKKDFKSTSQTTVTPDTLSCIEYTFDEGSNKLTITHINAGFNCCPDSIYAHIELNGDTIRIEESENMPLCDCNCLYDLDFEIEGVEVRTYQIKMIEPYAYEQDKLEFEIDLDQNTSGSFCVTRKQYPWGVYSFYE